MKTRISKHIHASSRIFTQKILGKIIIGITQWATAITFLAFL